MWGKNVNKRAWRIFRHLFRHFLMVFDRFLGCNSWIICWKTVIRVFWRKNRVAQKFGGCKLWNLKLYVGKDVFEQNMVFSCGFRPPQISPHSFFEILCGKKSIWHFFEKKRVFGGRPWIFVFNDGNSFVSGNCFSHIIAFSYFIKTLTGICFPQRRILKYNLGFWRLFCGFWGSNPELYVEKHVIQKLYVVKHARP
jgi:hypothetical protein